MKHKGNKLLVSTFNFMIIKQSNSVKKKVYETNQVVYTIVTKYQGRLGRGTGSRVEGRHLKKVWYEGGIPLWNDDPKIGT